MGEKEKRGESVELILLRIFNKVALSLCVCGCGCPIGSTGCHQIRYEGPGGNA